MPHLNHNAFVKSRRDEQGVGHQIFRGNVQLRRSSPVHRTYLPKQHSFQSRLSSVCVGSGAVLP